MSFRVLVVDDQADVRDLTSTVLATEGYRVTTLESGARAVEVLGCESFDLLLLDINMPGIDGWEVLRMVRADDRLIGLRVVMFSVKGEPHDKIQSLQEGAADYITKPFAVDTLLARVARVLGSETRGPGHAAGGAVR